MMRRRAGAWRWWSTLLVGLVGAGCETSLAPRDQGAAPDLAVADAGPDDGGRQDDAARPPPPELGPTVSLGDAAPPPLSGGTLLVSRDGVRALVADADRDRLLLVDLAKLSVAREVTLAAHDEPGRAVEDGAGRFHVVLRRGGAIATIEAGGALSRRPVCAAPRGIAFRARTDELLVACAGGELQLLSAAAGGPTRTVQLERDLRDVVIDEGSGLPYVSVLRTATLLELDHDLRVTARLAPAYPGWIATVAFRTVARPGGGILMAHELTDSRVISTQEGGYGGGSICAGAPRPPIVMSALTRFAHGDPPTAIDTGDLPGVVLPVDVATTREGRIAVVSPGSARVAGMPQVVNVPSNLVSPLCAGYPDPDPLAGQAVAAAYDGAGNLWVQTREPSSLVLRAGPRRSEAGGTAAVIALGGAPRTDTGWELFHTDSGARLACASCHPEGGDDGRTWQFDFGARRTQWLKGGVGRRPPFHWNGDVTDIGELTDNVFSLRMLGPRLDASQRAALGAWLDTIPQLPPPSSLDPAAVARGRALFEDADVGCATCHKGSQLTNDDLADIGREMPFKVPGLLDLADHPPYLHDGCARTLRERFSPACGGDRHGDVSGLSPAQLDDLVAYLESL